ncbi:MAG TPA: hypothetical protein DHW02_07640 [Ktedonobacter sp.]|nr:hypothetical protein [Ktedonobacter sp.]
MICPNCQAQNRDGVRYCGNCGRSLTSTTPGMTPQPSITPATSLSNTAANFSSPQLTSTSARSLAPGSQLQGGRYVIKRVLGQGGMGAALLAIDNRLDSKSVVIKELVSEHTDPQQLQNDVRNFKREVAMLAHIDHPLVPNVTDHFQEGLRYFMVQEYVDGETLEERIDTAKQPLRERDVLIYASQILDVLDYLTQQNPPVVHRDIKPANIIIGAKDKRAHLVDFGIARADVVKNAKRRQTSALGTPGYAPPEQYQGNADPRSDLYALAATMHHLLTNRDPRNHPPFNYPPARTLNPQLSTDTERVLTRALNNDINQRYQSAAAMKQNIDDILLHKFGISIDSYLLNTSEQMTVPDPNSTVRNPVTSQSGTQVAIPLTPASPPTSPVGASNYRQLPPYQNYPQSQPIQPIQPTPIPPIQYTPPNQQSKRRNRTPLYLLLALLLLLLISSGVFAYSRLPHGNVQSTVNGNNTPTTSSGIVHGIGVTKIGNDTIGISDGTYILDPTSNDATFKQQAATALKRNDTSTAIADFNSALAQSPNDAEAHIYLENLRVMSSGSPYVTLVVATMLSLDNVGVGRDDLQGAYIAQKEFNDGSKLSSGYKVRLLIASSGSQAQYAQNVAQQIVQLAQSDKSFVGVMGWPFSSRTADAVGILGKNHIPLVSQTSSSDALSGISPYFFRVVPSNTIQGSVGAHYAEQTLHANTAAIFVDNTDPYSQTLAQDFQRQFTADGKTIVDTETYKEGKTDTLPASLQKALSFHPDIIYFSGYAADMSTLLTNLPPGNTTNILGGDALYELNGYTSSARVDFSHLRFTAFAYPDEWDILGQTANKPAFFAEYAHAYSTNASQVGYGYTRSDNDATLSYDATVALLKAANSVLAGGNQQVTPQNEQQALTHTSFQGVSGQIHFGTNGDPVNKAIVILSVDPKGQIGMELPVQGQFFT